MPRSRTFRAHAISIGFVAVIALFTCLILSSTPTDARAEERADSETGYWQLVSTKTTPGEYSMADEAATIVSDGLRHTESYQQFEPGEPDELFVSIQCVSTCNRRPPNTIFVGDSFDMVTTIEFVDVWYLRWDYANPRRFACFVSSNLHVEPSELNGISFLDVDWDPKAKQTKTYTLTAEPSMAGKDVTISFTQGVSYAHCTTMWTYEWVGDSVTYRLDDQVTSTIASENPGSQFTDILTSIIDGFDPTEGGLYTIIGGIAAGTIAIIAGVSYLSFRRRRKEGARHTKKDEPQRKEPTKTYRMVVSKDFGSKLRPGARPKDVRVRIEESSDGGTTYVPNRDLTANIRAIGERNLTATDKGTTATDKVVEIQVPKGGATGGDPILALSYQGQYASFINRVSFQLMEDPVIAFTNVRGKQLAEKSCDVDALLGDDQGSVFYFCVRNFTEKSTREVAYGVENPKVEIASNPTSGPLVDTMPLPGGVTLRTKHARLELTPDILPFFEGDKAVPYFQVRVMCPTKERSPYGAWPVTVQLPIRVVGDVEEGDVAEATVTLLLWPEGIFFDTSIAYELPTRMRLPDDRVVVDTTIEWSRQFDDYRLRTSYIGIGAAYKVAGGIVEVQALNYDPDRSKYQGAQDIVGAEIGTRWTRLTPANEASKRVLDDNDPRIWYDLRMTLGVYMTTTPTAEGLAPIEASSLVKDEPNARQRVSIAHQLSSRRRGIYSLPARVSFAEVEPLMPLLVEDTSVEFRGELFVEHWREGIDREHGVPSGAPRLGLMCGSTLTVSFTGMVEGPYMDEREQLIRDINRLLAVFRSHDFRRTQWVFAKYGLRAERVRQRLGSEERIYATGMSTDALLGEITYIQSVQRLRFIRQSIFEVGIEYVRGEGEHIPWLFGDLSTSVKTYLKNELDIEDPGLSYAELASFYDLNLAFWEKARWAVDLAFTCWWYRLVGKNGGYVEAIATPIKNWVLDWVGEAALSYTDDEYRIDPDKSFTPKRLWELFDEIIENELLNVFVSSLVHADGRLATEALRKGLNALGVAWCFFLYVHVKKNLRRNPATGLNELDLWEALKGATKDCTLFGLKAVISIVIAWIFGKFASRNMRAATAPEKKIADSVSSFRSRTLKEDALWWHEKAKGWFGTASETWKDLGRGVQTRLDSPLFTERDLHWEVIGTDGEALPIYNPLDVTKRNEIWQGVIDSTVQKTITDKDMSYTRDVQDKGWTEPFAEWYRGLGTCDVAIPDFQGKPVLYIRMPFGDLISLMVDWLFDHWDFSETFERISEAYYGMGEPEYIKHPELVDKMRDIPKAEREVRFLTGQGEDTSRRDDGNTDLKKHFSDRRFW